MELLDELLRCAAKEGWATGHFNVSTLEQMRVICRVCRDHKSPAIIGTSEGERKYIGLAEAVAVRDALRAEFAIPIFLNADHTKSVEAAKAALDAGYDSVHIDLSAEKFDDNVRGTAEVVNYARLKSEIPRFRLGSAEGGRNPKSEISVEGELGFLRGESKIQNKKIEIRPEDLTKPEEARAFVHRTGVDRLAPVVGNAHGLSVDEPDLDIDRIKAIRHFLPDNVTLVLHGGSGIPPSQIRAAIQAGIANIHVNTDLRVAFVGGLREHIEAHPDETTPYKLFPEAEEAMAKVVEERLKLFNAVNRI